MISSGDMVVFGEEDTSVCINTHWDISLFILDTLYTKYHGPQMKVHDRTLTTYDRKAVQTESRSEGSTMAGMRIFDAE